MTDTELLTNTDLEYYAGLFKIPLNGVFSKDLFESKRPKLGNYVVNLENSDYGGSHWTCLILTKNMAIYYDSFGAPMPQEIIRFVKRFNNKAIIIYSIDQIQHIDSIYCGWFCLELLHWFSVRHKKNTNYRVLLNKHNAQYDLDNRKSNDDVLKFIIKTINDKLK